MVQTVDIRTFEYKKMCLLYYIEISMSLKAIIFVFFICPGYGLHTLQKVIGKLYQRRSIETCYIFLLTIVKNNSRITYRVL